MIVNLDKQRGYLYPIELTAGQENHSRRNKGEKDKKNRRSEGTLGRAGDDAISFSPFALSYNKGNNNSKAIAECAAVCNGYAVPLVQL